jgi:nicotinamidase-related amidase
MKAMVVIDMLQDFVDESGALPVKGASEIIPNIKMLVNAARKNGVMVCYANDSHDPDDFEFKKWPRHSVQGTKESMVIPELKPEKGDIIISKNDLSMFTYKDTDTLLKSKGIKELILTGMATDYCVQAAALDVPDKYGKLVCGAISRGYKVSLVVDAIKPIDLKPGDSARCLLLMGKAGVKALTTDEVLKEIART